MALPSYKDLQLRQNEAQEKIKSLQEAQDRFIAEWEKLEAEHQDLLHQVDKYLNTTKIHHISNFIKKIN